MEISGKVIQALVEQSGNGRNGTWRKRDYVIETGGNYPKKVCVTVWGDKIDQFDLKVGEEVSVGIELESREYNGKWYTDVKVWKVNKGGSPTKGSVVSEPDVTTFNDESGDDILPF
ncbi:hypothetical protein ADIS_2725 [Lunatimonas lonarensis]|uniref:DUF3127 domain-containing protein n=1 Tax=Lunatimonas lonarensis TaxID=1232681 RepID=R7ZS75_9BACT|nr:DUF3127 domain-containing protein [Lunatimonas lonarensis]EON76854.1 hypothetical protein ADIS_2725 [Lunatimonas lonarensis]